MQFGLSQSLMLKLTLSLRACNTKRLRMCERFRWAGKVTQRPQMHMTNIHKV